MRIMTVKRFLSTFSVATLVAALPGCELPIKGCFDDCPQGSEDSKPEEIKNFGTCQLEDTIEASASCGDGVIQPGELCNVFGYGGYGFEGAPLVSSISVPHAGDATSDQFLAYASGLVVAVSAGGSSVYWPGPAPSERVLLTGVGDFDADGVHDIAARSDLSSDRVHVFLMGGDGLLASEVEIVEAPDLLGPDVVDWDGDGHLDMVVVLPHEAQAENVVLYRGDGAGGFTQAPLFGLADDLSVRAFLAVGADGISDDLAYAGPEGGVALRLTAPDGPASHHLELGEFAAVLDIAVADLDADGDDDIAALVEDGADHTSRLAVALQLSGDASPEFVVEQFPVRCGAVALAIGDLNADGALDVATATPGESEGLATIRLGDGAGDFSAMITAYIGNEAHDLRIVDIQGDGVGEIITTNQTLGMLESTGNLL